MPKKKASSNPVMRVLRALNDVLAKLGHLIGMVVNPVIVGIIYVFVLGPVSLLRRVQGDDGLGLKWKQTPAPEQTYYHPVSFRNDSIAACRRQF